MSDRDVFARALRKARGSSPSATNLEAAITDIKVNDTMKGSSTIIVSLFDVGYELTDASFFDANDDGRIDPIDVNYPEGSKLWWRCTQVGWTLASGGAQYELTFMERAAVHMMQHHGPFKVSRGKRTRAEFLKMLTAKVKAGGGITFHSKQLHVKQRQADEDPATVKAREKSDAEAKTSKDAGIASGERISFENWDGSTYTLKPGEIHNAERVLREAVQHSTDERPLLAALVTCIVEAPFFRNPLDGDADSVGIMQLRAMHGPVSKRRDIAWVVSKFMDDGFTGAGGAVALAKEHKDWTVGQIAQAVQGSAFPARYDKVRDGAEKVLKAFGGAGGSGGEYRQQYNFEIGSTANPKENYWEGAGRLADEVNWAFFVDGQNVYFDPETSLIRQRPVAVVRRDDPYVVGFNCTWDMRNIATEATLELVCEPFEFRAGEVFKLEDFGAASSGSTAKLPGRWLIEDIDRAGLDSVTSVFTLKQPEDPNPEPRSDTRQRQADEATTSVGSITGSPKHIIDTVVLPIARACGVPRTVAQNDASNATHGPTVKGARSDHQGPPDVAWAADMSNGTTTPQEDKLAKALAERFDIDWSGSGLVSKIVSEGGETYRVQLIYRTMEGGNHYTHVHFGIKRLVQPVGLHN